MCLVVLLGGCGPADLERHLTTYQRLLVAIQADAQPGDLWFAATAPPDVRPLMADLRLNALHHDTTAIYFRAGGGYLPAHGYVYCLPQPHTDSLSICGQGLTPVAGQWYRY